jgi:hypothetical protein
MVYKLRNTGNVVWSKDSPYKLRLGTGNPLNRISVFCDNSWLTCNRPVEIKESRVAPGEVGTFEFWYKAPTAKGVYVERFRPVIDAASWLDDGGLYFQTNVN